MRVTKSEINICLRVSCWWNCQNVTEQVTMLNTSGLCLDIDVVLPDLPGGGRGDFLRWNPLLSLVLGITASRNVVRRVRVPHLVLHRVRSYQLRRILHDTPTEFSNFHPATWQKLGFVSVNSTDSIDLIDSISANTRSLLIKPHWALLHIYANIQSLSTNPHWA